MLLKISFVILGFAAAIFGLFLAQPQMVFDSSSTSLLTRQIQAATECRATYEMNPEVIDCWMILIGESYDVGGTSEAFELFEHLYETYPMFANSGCHRQAHRVGDYAYYHDYLHHKDLSRVEFPPSAKACGYGFYHGFVEHVVQDTPTVEFVEETCAYLIDRLIEVAPAILQTCYHGAGHGFLIAVADTATNTAEMSALDFAVVPTERCWALDVHPDRLIDCLEGVYTVLVDWMWLGNYGLTYDYKDPFSLCNPLNEPKAFASCSTEVAQKFDSVSDRDVLVLLELVRSNRDTSIHNKLFNVGVSGIVQHNPEDIPVILLADCREIEKDYQATCFQAIVGGLFEHGIPDAEYQLADKFCKKDQLTEDEVAQCNRLVALFVYRFRTEQEVISLCRQGLLSSEVCAIAVAAESYLDNV